MSAPGWYSDPAGSGGQRYFDGMEWTAHYTPPMPMAYQQQQPYIVPVSHGSDHTFHLLMTVFTCGFWAPIWAICEIMSASRKR